jgi:hypothetical protein
MIINELMRRISRTGNFPRSLLQWRLLAESQISYSLSDTGLIGDSFPTMDKSI